MNTERDIIVFADDWGRYPSTMQYIGRILAERHRIVWVGSLGLRKPRIHLADAGRIVEKARSIFRHRTASAAGSVIAAHPMVLPFHDLAPVRILNAASITRAVRGAAREHGFIDPIVITASPLTGALVGQLGESSFHYVCLDDFSRFEGAFKCIGPLERELVALADTVFSVSDILRDSRMPASGRGYYLPQGVDTDHFRRREAEPPLALRTLPRPLIGFFGILAPWIDQELLVRTAKAFPHASVVLLGRTSTDLSLLRRSPNIHYLGEIPYTELPSWGQWFDVGLIPFQVNDLTLASNPLKLLEYLALGLPVVSTDLPEVRKFGDLVRVGSSGAEFVESVGRAIGDTSTDLRDRRRQKAEKYSWRAITDDMMNKVLEADAAKRTRPHGEARS